MIGTFGYPRRRERPLLILYYSYAFGILGLYLMGYAILFFWIEIADAVEYNDLQDYPFYYASTFGMLAIAFLYSLYLIKSACYAFDNKDGTLRFVIICFVLQALVLAAYFLSNPEELPVVDYVLNLITLLFYVFYIRHRMKKGFFSALPATG